MKNSESVHAVKVERKEVISFKNSVFGGKMRKFNMCYSFLNSFRNNSNISFSPLF